MLIRYFARDITVEVDTGTARREAFLVRRTIDVSLQCGIDVLRPEHATCHQVAAYPDLQRTVRLPWLAGEGSGEQSGQLCDVGVDFVVISVPH
jgi:hypothetical protein